MKGAMRRQNRSFRCVDGYAMAPVVLQERSYGQRVVQNDKMESDLQGCYVISLFRLFG